MKRRSAVFKVSLIAIMIAILCVALSACGLIDALKVVTDADIVAVYGLEEVSGGEYTANLGQEIKISVDWHNKRVASPSIEWHVVLDEDDAVVLKDKSTLTRTFTREDLGKTYSYYVVVEGNVKSDPIKITPVEAPLSEPTISCSSHSLVDGKIQQNLLVELTNVSLGASWNEDDISKDIDVYVKWYVDGVAAGEGKTFTYNAATLVKGDCTVVVTVEIGYEKDGEKVSKTASVTLVFVSEYSLASSVKVVPYEEGGRLQRIVADTYYLQGEASDESSALFTTSLLPDSAYQGASCVWTVRSGDIVLTLPSSERTASIPLSYGKNIIKASIDNIESRQVIVYVLSYAFDEIPTDIKGAMTDKFVWKGNSYDKYVSSQYDLNACVGSAVSEHKIDVGYQMHIGRADWRSNDSFLNQCSTAMEQGNDESGAFSYSVSVSGSSATLTFKSATKFGIPSGAYPTPDQSNQAKVYVRYTEQSIKRTSLPIDEFSEQVEVSNSNDLYRAAAYGYKPVFVGDNAAKLQSLYDKARSVLFKYISDDMSEVEKVAAIYDWIVCNVEYDHAVASTLGNSSGYNAFYLEGVFDDNRAVCDGKSKAFALLCGMEGIRALRITGEALTGDSYGGHAWNKVLVDADGDGVREWYVVDTTWGDAAVKTAAGSWEEYLTYSYFLRTDADIADTHRSTVEQPEAKTVYNTYKNTYVYVGTQKVSLYVKTAAELNLLLAYSKANGGLCLSVYIEKGARGSENFGHLTPVRDGEYVIFASSSIDF